VNSGCAYEPSIIPIQVRIITRLRALGTGVSRSHAESCQAPFDDCHFARGPTKRKRARGSRADFGQTSSGPHSTVSDLFFFPITRKYLLSLQEISNYIFTTYFNLCRLKKSRQEEAAQAGIISSLKRIIETSSPLSSLCFPFFNLASVGKGCRTLFMAARWPLNVP